MPLSQTALQGVLAASTAAVYLDTLTITHSRIDTIRIVNDVQNLTRAAGEFLAFPFTVTAPAQTAERPPQLKFTIDIVDERMIEALRPLRGLREGVKIMHEIVRADEPDVIEHGPATFTFLDFKTDGATKAVLTAGFLPGALNDSYPARRFSPANAGA